MNRDYAVDDIIGLYVILQKMDFFLSLRRKIS